MITTYEKFSPNDWSSIRPNFAVIVSPMNWISRKLLTVELNFKKILKWLYGLGRVRIIRWGWCFRSPFSIKSFHLPSPHWWSSASEWGPWAVICSQLIGEHSPLATITLANHYVLNSMSNQIMSMIPLVWVSHPSFAKWKERSSIYWKSKPLKSSDPPTKSNIPKFHS